MTLHTYAVFDRLLMCMSDSLTTYKNSRNQRLDTIKTVTYPLDSATWAPGQLAAAVMTQERATFGDTIEACQIVYEALAGQSFHTIKEVGVTVWQAFREHMMATCPSCERAAASYQPQPEELPVDLQELEIGCDEGHELEVHVVGIEGPSATPKRYARRWAPPPDLVFDVQCLPDRTAFRSGFLVRGRQYERESITADVTQPFERSAAFEQMQHWFYNTAKSSKFGLTKSVGGAIRTVIIDPTAGLARLPHWTLETYGERS
ncbi:hypothetical protein [Nocardia sp. NPDC057272]|uniref:hypothetical protein n=1 Tax=Nocardia sp. NPDC057272 TaxID=3346079 RepID=UPI003634DE6A